MKNPFFRVLLIINQEIGRIYDTVFYCLTYFNEKAVEEVILNEFLNTAFMQRCYQEIKVNIPSLPEILRPVFYYNQQSSVMTDFLTEQIDFKNETIDSFLKKLVSSSDVLFQKTIERLFKNDVCTQKRSISPIVAPASYIEALSDADYPDDFKLQISLLFGNFNYTIALLAETLQEVYTQVDLLHQKYADQLSFAFRQLSGERNIELYRQLLSLDIHDTNDQVCVALSLLNQYIIKVISKDGNIGLLLGFCYEHTLNLRFDEKNIDLKQFLIAVGNDIRYSIIEELTDHGELTAASLAKLLQIPPTTILRHVEVLYRQGIIYISRKTGLQIFYQLNQDLFSKIGYLLKNRFGGKVYETIEKKAKNHLSGTNL